MTVEIKNVSGVIKNWGSFTLANNSKTEVFFNDRDRLLADSLFLTDLQAGDAELIVDGNTYPPEAAERFLNSEVAVSKNSNTVVDPTNEMNFFGNLSTQNEGNGKTSLTIGGGSSILGTMYTLTFFQDGGLKDAWVSYVSKDADPQRNFAVIPFDSRIQAITAQTREDTADFQLDFRKSGKDQGTSFSTIFTYSFSGRYGVKRNFSSPLDFQAGDKLLLYSNDAGNEPKSMIVEVYLKVKSDENTDLTRQFDGKFGN